MVALSLSVGSDDSEDDVSLGMQCHQLMDRTGLAEAAVYELMDEHRLNVTVRSSSIRIVGPKLP